ncbi:MAG: 50S ribosomal protein L25 [Patescibacteria group bacterium]
MFVLEAEKRDIKTKPAGLRREGKVPAVFYGRKEKSTPIAFSEVDFKKVWDEAGESSIIDLVYGGKKLNVLIHDVDVHPVTGKVIHADLYAVEADKPVEVSVELVFEGDAPAVKIEGASIVKVLHALEVSGLPKDLPQKLTVSLTGLETPESQIFAKDISLPSGITLMMNPDDVVAAISMAKVEEEVPVAFDASQIEVEKKGKEEEAEGESALPEAAPSK